MKTNLTLLLLLVNLCTLVGITKTSDAEIVYLATMQKCTSCNGSGEYTCPHCKGVDLTELTCLNCKGVDLTLETCLNCKGEDLTKQTCLNCRGVDLTKLSCSNCKGSGAIFDGSRCFMCSGTGKQSRCFICSGTGKQSRCFLCSGTGKQSRCFLCSGSGKQSRCFICSGKSSLDGICTDCNGVGKIQVITKKMPREDTSLQSQGTTISKSNKSRAPPKIAENGSYYGEIGTSGKPKTVFVSGYLRKDGTYVKSHYRSLPSSSVSKSSKEPKLIYGPGVAENGSYYGQPNQYGVPKTIHVRGYYRKDGTYVRGHYRSKSR